MAGVRGNRGVGHKEEGLAREETRSRWSQGASSRGPHAAEVGWDSLKCVLLTSSWLYMFISCFLSDERVPFEVEERL